MHIIYIYIYQPQNSTMKSLRRLSIRGGHKSLGAPARLKGCRCLNEPDFGGFGWENLQATQVLHMT